MPTDKLRKHTLHLRDGDMDFLQDNLPQGKASETIRKIVSRFVDNIKDQQAKATPIDTDL